LLRIALAAESLHVLRHHVVLGPDRTRGSANVIEAPLSGAGFLVNVLHAASAIPATTLAAL
jgi:hypothetical protein